MSREEKLYGGLLEQLNLVMFEHTGDRLQRISPIPDWFEEHFPDAEKPTEHSDFLGHFMGEAAEHWAGETSHTLLRSGLWEERGKHLEALAVRVEESELLGIQLAGHRFEVFSEQVQRSNELSLERSKSDRETQRRVILLDCVVHDLSNPLAAVLVNLQFLAKRLPEGAESEAVRVALEQVERQRAMLRSVVGLFSADTALGGSGNTTTDAREAIEIAVRAQLDRATDCRVGLEFDSGAGTAKVVAEESYLVRAVENVIVNAIRHSPAGSKVSVCMEVSDGDLVIRVLDEGEGVAPESVDSLFDPFERSASSGGQAGLGLYFCKRALARWGGEITYEPNQPNGAQFCLQLRLVPE